MALEASPLHVDLFFTDGLYLIGDKILDYLDIRSLFRSTIVSKRWNAFVTKRKPRLVLMREILHFFKINKNQILHRPQFNQAFKKAHVDLLTQMIKDLSQFNVAFKTASKYIDSPRFIDTMPRRIAKKKNMVRETLTAVAKKNLMPDSLKFKNNGYSFKRIRYVLKLAARLGDVELFQSYVEQMPNCINYHIATPVLLWYRPPDYLWLCHNPLREAILFQKQDMVDWIIKQPLLKQEVLFESVFFAVSFGSLEIFKSVFHAALARELMNTKDIGALLRCAFQVDFGSEVDFGSMYKNMNCKIPMVKVILQCMDSNISDVQLPSELPDSRVSISLFHEDKSKGELYRLLSCHQVVKLINAHKQSNIGSENSKYKVIIAHEDTREIINYKRCQYQIIKKRKKMKMRNWIFLAFLGICIMSLLVILHFTE